MKPDSRPNPMPADPPPNTVAIPVMSKPEPIFPSPMRNAHTPVPVFNPDQRAFLARYRTWPAWRRWLWRHGIGG